MNHYNRLCGYPSQNVRHMIMACPAWPKGRGEIWRKAKDRSFKSMTNRPKGMIRMTQWILDQGWIEQFRMTGEVERVLKERETSVRKRGE